MHNVKTISRLQRGAAWPSLIKTVSMYGAGLSSRDLLYRALFGHIFDSPCSQTTKPPIALQTQSEPRRKKSCFQGFRPGPIQYITFLTNRTLVLCSILDDIYLSSDS